MEARIDHSSNIEIETQPQKDVAVIFEQQIADDLRLEVEMDLVTDTNGTSFLEDIDGLSDDHRHQYLEGERLYFLYIVRVFSMKHSDTYQRVIQKTRKSSRILNLDEHPKLLDNQRISDTLYFHEEQKGLPKSKRKYYSTIPDLGIFDFKREDSFLKLVSVETTVNFTETVKNQQFIPPKEGQIAFDGFDLFDISLTGAESVGESKNGEFESDKAITSRNTNGLLDLKSKDCSIVGDCERVVDKPHFKRKIEQALESLSIVVSFEDINLEYKATEFKIQDAKGSEDITRVSREKFALDNEVVDLIANQRY